ncbi:oligosaccharide flippase family protein [Auraticoccus cholistanensis]|uniref:oligosaccharide flippase family protein n=1 Tax=Auraticoccus cholistanensis TaxID=2656650 RepID=UPI0018D25459
MTDRTATSSSSASVARSGAVSLLGSGFSALMGFVLTFVLARSLGDAGAGVVLQVMAVFMIVISVARLGMDTASVWYLPRLVDEDQDQIRSALAVALGTALLAALAAGTAVWLLAPLLAPEPEVREALRACAWLVPAASTFLIALACTRALGGIGPYIAIGSIAVPLARPVLVLVAVAVGGTATTASLAWASPFLLGLLAALAVLVGQVRRHERRGGRPGRLRPRRAVLRPMLGFAGPRVVATSLEQALVWVDVLLVGAIAGSAAAGVYGSASRFLSAALLIDTAMRTVVTPLFSRLMWREDLAGVRSLFTRSTTWLVLFSTPVNVMLFVYAPLVLGWLGPEFVEGATVMRVLAVGMAVILCAGSVHSLLLMSGRSGLAAANKAAALTLNVVGNLLLVPVAGIEGAAAVWAACMLLDAVLATVQVRRATGVRLAPLPLLRAGVIGLVSFGVPTAAATWLLGQSVAALLAGGLVATVAFAGWVVADRRALHLDELRALRPGKRDEG